MKTYRCYKVTVKTNNVLKDTFESNNKYFKATGGHIFCLVGNLSEVADIIENDKILNIEFVGFGYIKGK